MKLLTSVSDAPCSNAAARPRMYQACRHLLCIPVTLACCHFHGTAGRRQSSPPLPASCVIDSLGGMSRSATRCHSCQVPIFANGNQGCNMSLWCLRGGGAQGKHSATPLFIVGLFLLSSRGGFRFILEWSATEVVPVIAIVCSGLLWLTLWSHCCLCEI